MLLGFDQYLVMWLFNFSIAISTWKALFSGISGCAVCISVCLRSLTPCKLNSWEKWFCYITKILWESVNKSPFLVLYYISYIHTHTHIYIHTYIHIYMYVCTYSFTDPSSVKVRLNDVEFVMKKKLNCNMQSSQTVGYKIIYYW
jgi:hypothetical protein